MISVGLLVNWRDFALRMVLLDWLSTLDRSSCTETILAIPDSATCSLSGAGPFAVSMLGAGDFTQKRFNSSAFCAFSSSDADFLRDPDTFYVFYVASVDQLPPTAANFHHCHSAHFQRWCDLCCFGRYFHHCHQLEVDNQIINWNLVFDLVVEF